MYEKRIKHKVATQAVKAKVKEKGGEAFTSNQLYRNKFRRIGEEVKVKTQNSWMRTCVYARGWRNVHELDKANLHIITRAKLRK